jgi:uncharacterized protein (DUF362 family)
MTTVAIARDDAIEKAIFEALDHLEVDPLIRGKLVAVKPNDTYASGSDRSGVTQPDALRALLRYIKRYGPGGLIVSGGSGAGETDEIFETAGLMEVIRDEGAEFHDHNRPPFREIELEYGGGEVVGPQKSVFVNERVLEYETLIALSQLKVHEEATVTLALKNVAMSFPAADYYGHPRSIRLHQHSFFEDLHSFIAAMFARFPIRLAVTVGHPAMIGAGPLGGHVFETGLVIAGEDALAVDVVGARMLGFEPQGVRHLWEAGRLGLGETLTSRMSFPGLGLEEAFQIFTQKAYGHGLSLAHA